MKINKKSYFSLILAGLILALVLVACGDATNTVAPASGATPAASQPAGGTMAGHDMGSMKPGETMPSSTTSAAAASSPKAATTSAASTTAASGSVTADPGHGMPGHDMGTMTTPTVMADTTGGNDPMTNSLKSLSGKDFEIAFMQEMIVHHQSAVDMAKLVAANTKRPELNKMAQDIISAQTKEINEMTGWLAGWYNAKPLTDSMSVPGMMEMMGDMDTLTKAKDAAFDKQFITMMIAHHQQAVSMANLLPSKTQRPELLKLGQDIVKTQSAEIAQMQSWQKAWFPA
ncbi:MAG TPA: DUF305 domain-containing protein [Chloroflexia bacterium]|nr:DUF305 domain-containing protein [Chloroflexia bacterium]